MPLPFNQESWIWYTCATMMIGARLISRYIHLRSIKNLQYDDWIMGIFITAAYTALIVCSNRYVKAQSNLLPPGFDFQLLSPEDLARRRYGSKMVVVVEQTQIAVIWACKACLLIMYHRLTRTALRNENVAIKLLFAYVALGFVVMEVLYFAVWCRPVTEYWAVPTSSSQCNALINHRIVKAVFNLSSDIVMLVIALQMLIRSLLPLKRKLILCGIFSLGIFVIIASILNSYYSFMNPYKQTWTFWYVRESSTAILVANLPFTWTILRQFFDLGTFDEANPPPWTFHSARTAQGRRTAQLHSHSAQTAASARQFPSATASKGSQGTQAMTLVDSLSPLRSVSDKHSPGPSVQSSDIQHEYTDGTIQHHDFAAFPSPSADVGVIRIDLEHGLDHAVLPRLASPDVPQQSEATITEDGTGGFYMNGRPVAPPPRVFLATQMNHSRDPSIARVEGRPISPSPSFTSIGSMGLGHRRGGGTAGTGRSARDRRARARMSE